MIKVKILERVHCLSSWNYKFAADDNTLIINNVFFLEC